MLDQAWSTNTWGLHEKDSESITFFQFGFLILSESWKEK